MEDLKTRPYYDNNDLMAAYNLAVIQHLQGDEPSTEYELPNEFSLLLQARRLSRQGQYNHALKSLAEVGPTEAPFIIAEKNLVSGMIRYSQEEYIESLDHYKTAYLHYIQLGFAKKACLAKYNMAKNYYMLGKDKKAYQIEVELSRFASEVGDSNIGGLCLRSRGYRSLRHQEFQLAKQFFNDSFQLLLQAYNPSDAALSFYYSLLCRIRLNEEREDILNLCERKFESKINQRAENFKLLVSAFLKGEDHTLRLKNCDSDIQTAFEACFGKEKNKYRPRKKVKKLSQRLLDFLEQTSAATPEECIAYLWSFEGVDKSLQQRLWTLVSRINKEKPIIILNADNKYEIY